MSKKIITFGIIFILLLVEMMGCFEEEKTEEDRFIGVWKLEDGRTMTFYSNGNCNFIIGEGDWELKNNMIYITVSFKDGKNKMAYNYSFTNNDNTLTFIDAGDRTWVYSKQ